MVSLNLISGNLRVTLSDRLQTFLSSSDIFLSSSFPGSNEYEKDCLRFDQDNFN